MPSLSSHRGPTIGVFDSGFGGLTGLRAPLPLIPNAHYIYLGDTARLPYGSKSRGTIARYAVESARFLAAQGAHLLVIACNTATALALHDIIAAVDIPVVGVIEPVVRAAETALSQRQNGVPHVPLLGHGFVEQHMAIAAPEVLVLATAATVQSHAYRDICASHALHATEKACPLLVPLIEEGWTDHPVTRDVLAIYLREALAACTPQAVLLGCTHYPLIATVITETLRDLGSNALVIDSAAATAHAVAHGIAQQAGLPNPTSTADPHSTFHCYATDSIEKFARLGSVFLGQPITQIELLDLGG